MFRSVPGGYQFGTLLCRGQFGTVRNSSDVTVVDHNRRGEHIMHDIMISRSPTQTHRETRTNRQAVGAI